MCTPYISRALRVIKIIIIYANFLEFIDNKKIRGRWWGIWWCIHPAYLIIIYVIFL
jgi:hypothetical protein